MNELDAKGVGVVLEASHTCMSIRGVHKPESMTVTSAMRGIFRSNMSTRHGIHGPDSGRGVTHARHRGGGFLPASGVGTDRSACCWCRPPRPSHASFACSTWRRLGLLTAAGFFLVLHRGWTNVLMLGIALSLACCFVGSIVWHLEGCPLARLLVYPAVLSLTWVLFAVSHETGMLAEAVRRPGMLEAAYREQAPWYVVGAFTSAALLGICTSAMLMGHSYLLAPTMSLKPLMRLFAAGRQRACRAGHAGQRRSAHGVRPARPARRGWGLTSRTS